MAGLGSEADSEPRAPSTAVDADPDPDFSSVKWDLDTSSQSNRKAQTGRLANEPTSTSQVTGAGVGYANVMA